jgi:hypothetical protein
MILETKLKILVLTMRNEAASGNERTFSNFQPIQYFLAGLEIRLSTLHIAFVPLGIKKELHLLRRLSTAA